MINSVLRKSFIPGISPRISSRCGIIQSAPGKDIFVKSNTTSFKGCDKCEAAPEISPTKTEIPGCISEVINETETVSKTIKEEYDERYGKDNWEYVSIGRSCGYIAEALEMQGVKTYLLPISGLSYVTGGYKALTEQSGFPKYRQYMYDKGLNPENINNSGKKYIFQDYSNSGRSIKLFEDFIRSPEVGLDSENVIFESINNVLAAKEEKLKKSGINPGIYLTDRFALQDNFYSYKYFMSDKRFPCDDLGKIDEYDKIQTEPTNEEKLFRTGLKAKFKETT